ncbi:MAG: YdcF family protein [Anaerolineaceae bacterium]|nr:YdcF family protein [Anaerolineaceae bacterium]
MKHLLKRIFRLVLISAGLYLLAAVLLGAAGMVEDHASADALVVFGNKVEPSGEPSPSLASRLDRALVLFQEGGVEWVIVSGGFGKEGWDEAEVMADYLAERGVPRQVILIDREGNNTLLTALHSAELAQKYNLHSFLLVSHFYHLPRARLAFERLGLAQVSIAHAERFVARDFYYGLLREVIAYPVYYFRKFPAKPSSSQAPAE